MGGNGGGTSLVQTKPDFTAQPGKILAGFGGKGLGTLCYSRCGGDGTNRCVVGPSGAGERPDKLCGSGGRADSGFCGDRELPKREPRARAPYFR